MKQPLKPLYGVAGNPVQHSLSPWLHRHFSTTTQRPAPYAAYPVPLDGFAKFVEHFFSIGGQGLNITLPFKEQAYQLADTKSNLCQKIGAANVLMLKDGKIHAFNTDGGGFISDIAHALPAPLTHRRVLLLGAGGAAKAVAVALAKQQPDVFHIHNRTPQKAEKLAQLCNATAVTQPQGNYHIIINATSTGHTATPLALPDNLFHQTALAYDLSYGAAAQPFLSQAKNGGAARCYDGIGMLVRQAALSFALWQGVMPAVSPLLTHLRGR